MKKPIVKKFKPMKLYEGRETGQPSVRVAFTDNAPQPVEKKQWMLDALVQELWRKSGQEWKLRGRNFLGKGCYETELHGKRVILYEKFRTNARVVLSVGKSGLYSSGAAAYNGEELVTLYKIVSNKVKSSMTEAKKEENKKVKIGDVRYLSKS